MTSEQPPEQEGVSTQEVTTQASIIQPAPGLARSASVLAIGNATSRVLGLVREIVIAALFGATGEVSAFRVASQVPILLYDFLVGGMLSAALVPVLSETLQMQSRAAYQRLVSLLLTIFSLGTFLLALLLFWGAPRLTLLLAGGFQQTNPELLPLTTRLMQLAAPVVWLLSMAGLLTAILYSLQRFAFPSLATALYNLGIVAAAPLLVNRIGIYSLVVGILLGGVTQLSLMGYDLYRAGIRFHVELNWRHPALAKILRLYAPIAVGLVVSLFQIGLDRRLASGVGEQSIAWMSNATTLQQMPLGLISVAISLAALPRLSQYYAANQDRAYRRTLGHGLRLVLLLIVPAGIALWLLGEPLTRLFFEHNRFTPADTTQVVQALNIYVVGMIFAAVDFPLNFAFYARNNTLLPALVGVLSVGVYVVVAFALIDGLGYLGLVWADSAKQAGHALVMVGLLWWRVGRLRMGVGRGMVMVGAGGVVMIMSVLGLSFVLRSIVRQDGFWGDLLLLVVAGGGGVLGYGVTLWLMGMRELREVVAAATRRWSIRRLP